MPTAVVRDTHINYEVVGSHGPWMVLTPGGRSGLEAARPLATKLAGEGYRVLIHDRLNCGASDVLIADGDWEDATTADYLHELMQQLGALPALGVAMAGGNRINFFVAIRHPTALQGLMPCWPSGGRRAAEILAHDYYGQHADAARRGGMAAVAQTDYYRERIAQNPRNRDLLAAMDADVFIATMERWERTFLRSADWPTVAIPEVQLRSISVRSCIVAGLTDDDIHGRHTSEGIASIIPDAEIRYLPDERRPADAGPNWLREALPRRGALPELTQAIHEFAGDVNSAAPHAAE